MKVAGIWISSSLLYTPFLLADFVQGQVPPQDLYHAGYNAPAQTLLPGKNWGPNISLDASFLYYYAAEDGLDLASSASLVTSGSSSGVVTATGNSVGLTQDFDYSPGFKVGLGFSWSDWNTDVEYTWIRQTTSTNQGPISPTPAEGTGVWISDNWFQQVTSTGQNMTGTDVSSKWKLSMDMVDATIEYPLYLGRRLVISPLFGVSGLWMRQKLDMTMDVTSSIVFDLGTSQVTSHNISRSWAVGPCSGFDLSWLLGQGVRVEGNAAVGLLFTQYSFVKHSENVASVSSSPSTLNVSLSDVNCLRPQLNLGLGLGWGTHIKQQKYYIDVSATYDFWVFWQQNMMRKLLDQTVSGTGAAAGDLYLQGLDVKFAFRF